MVVTSSSKHAVRYYFQFKEYIRENGYTDIRPLVAFSGTVIDDGFPDGVTEANLNGFGEKQLPDKFDTPEYQGYYLWRTNIRRVSTNRFCTRCMSIRSCLECGPCRRFHG